MNVGEKGKKVEDKNSMAAELFEAISHPTRIQILRALRENALGFAELKHKLGISSSGNLSHHLGKLVILVKTNDQGKYEITDQGREALIALETVRDPLGSRLVTTHVRIPLFFVVFILLVVNVVVSKQWVKYSKYIFHYMFLIYIPQLIFIALILIGVYYVGRKIALNLKANLRASILSVLIGACLGWWVGIVITGQMPQWSDIPFSYWILALLTESFRTFFMAFTALSLAYLRSRNI